MLNKIKSKLASWGVDFLQFLLLPIMLVLVAIIFISAYSHALYCIWYLGVRKDKPVVLFDKKHNKFVKVIGYRILNMKESLDDGGEPIFLLVTDCADWQDRHVGGLDCVLQHSYRKLNKNQRLLYVEDAV